MTQEEARKIIQVIDAFALEMKAKMFIEATQRKFGWDDLDSIDWIREQLTSLASHKDLSEHAIDIANLAMMLWYHSDDEWSKRINQIREKLNAQTPIDRQ